MPRSLPTHDRCREEWGPRFGYRCVSIVYAKRIGGSATFVPPETYNGGNVRWNGVNNLLEVIADISGGQVVQIKG